MTDPHHFKQPFEDEDMYFSLSSIEPPEEREQDSAIQKRHRKWIRKELLRTYREQYGIRRYLFCDWWRIKLWNIRKR